MFRALFSNTKAFWRFLPHIFFCAWTKQCQDFKAEFPRGFQTSRRVTRWDIFHSVEEFCNTHHSFSAQKARRCSWNTEKKNNSWFLLELCHPSINYYYSNSRTFAEVNSVQTLLTRFPMQEFWFWMQDFQDLSGCRGGSWGVQLRRAINQPSGADLCYWTGRTDDSNTSWTSFGCFFIRFRSFYWRGVTYCP